MMCAHKKYKMYCFVVPLINKQANKYQINKERKINNDIKDVLQAFLVQCFQASEASTFCFENRFLFLNFWKSILQNYFSILFK